MLTNRANKSHFDDIRTTLLDARLCYQAWWILVGTRQQRDSILAVYNRYLHFFEAVRPALFTTFAVKLATLFGRRSDEITLKSLLGAEADPKFGDLWKRGRRLYWYRSKVIAHRDLAVLSTDFAKKTGFTHKDLRMLLEDTSSLFDRLADNHGFERVPPLSSKEDLLALIKNLSHTERI